jgi:hypothetical protein
MPDNGNAIFENFSFISKSIQSLIFLQRTILWSWLTEMLTNGSVTFENFCFISKRIKILNVLIFF